jgi:microcystin-dependent protein
VSAPTWETGSFPSGTVMLFQQTSAPTGWTKLTTHDNKALRVVSGTASTGGSTGFSSVFASRTPTGSVSGSNSGGGVNAHTLTTAEMPSHTHNARSGTVNSSFSAPIGSVTRTLDLSTPTDATGGGGSHTHGFTQPSWSGSFSGAAMDFAVAYVDVIFASKN